MQAVADYNYAFKHLDPTLPEQARANIAMVMWQMLQQGTLSAFQEMQEILCESALPEEGMTNGE